ncbi:hypothetical protein NE235_12035 [Actinoallomurus spadix]|uniref:hypothetical protein n=1 Tax=Actinoallomurus spadix TaxID=79912 RepID=UPI0020926675|nr:hypothetical protein [Actinoallomurus spadix]MCO5986831.1 hypothetical protein [Actinoallomurus spadix]
MQRLSTERGEHGGVRRLLAPYDGGGLFQALPRVPRQCLGGVPRHTEDLGGLLGVESVRQREDLAVPGAQEGQRAAQRVGRGGRRDAAEEGAAPYALGSGERVQPHGEPRVVIGNGVRVAGDGEEDIVQGVARFDADHDVAVGVERLGVLVIERAERLRSTRP